MIWNVADMLRGPFKPHEYGLVILPMTVVKRFHNCLLPTHDKVPETYEKVKSLEVVDGFLTRASGYQFFNISQSHDYLSYFSTQYFFTIFRNKYYMVLAFPLRMC